MPARVMLYNDDTEKILARPSKGDKSLDGTPISQNAPPLTKGGNGAKPASTGKEKPKPDPVQRALGALSQGHKSVVGALEPAYEAVAPMREQMWGNQTPMGMLSEGHMALMKKLAQKNKDYSTWNQAMRFLSMPQYQQVLMGSSGMAMNPLMAYGGGQARNPGLWYS